ncbi:MAG: hypothetical protein JWO19_3566 [Bryobacterales bacterium]|nr:hypothetical protein [Bryobacterales bacterium]
MGYFREKSVVIPSINRRVYRVDDGVQPPVIGLNARLTVSGERILLEPRMQSAH